MAELWRRPWALVDRAKRHRLTLADAPVEIAPDHRASVWLYSPGGEMLLVDGRKNTTEPVAGFTLKDEPAHPVAHATTTSSEAGCVCDRRENFGKDYLA